MDQASYDLKKEIICFQFSERIKSELIIASRLLWTIEELKGDELKGGKKMIFTFLDALIAETNIAYNVVKLKEFYETSTKLNSIKDKIGSEHYQEAAQQISEAISFITTCGQRSAEVLRERELFN